MICLLLHIVHGDKKRYMLIKQESEEAAHDIARTLIRNRQRGDKTKFRKIPIEMIDTVDVVTINKRWNDEALSEWESAKTLS